MTILEAAYQAALDYLYGFVDYSLQRNFQLSPERFDLNRMRQFGAALGNPQDQYPILHVAGTKGKGSTAVFCASALQAAGYKVGLYTSPHLDDYAERIQVNGEPIAHSELIALVDELRPLIPTIPQLTTFEITTALAFLYFARRGVDAAVIEVGLGGRLDATNICRPLVTVITSISYDHTQVLGSTLALIAAEKAGIVKTGTPLVVAPQVDDVYPVFEQIAAERGASLIEVGRDVRFAPIEHGLSGQSFRLWQGETAHELKIRLLGAHQIENAATAWTALQTARRQGLTRLTDETIAEGLERAVWPGRFEVLQLDPPLVLDCAHNRDSARRLRQALEAYFPGYGVVLLFGASEDKDIAGMLAELSPLLVECIIAKSFHPRAADSQAILAALPGDYLPVRVIADVAEALPQAMTAARQLSDQRPTLALVAGSIFIAAGARQAWLSHKENP